jgi:hypothetical protein
LLSGRFTKDAQFFGKATGAASGASPRSAGDRFGKLDQRQSSARATRFARSALRSTYRQTVAN